jgi:hypothetical protein
VRKPTVLLLPLLVCLAGIAWWTATPRTAQEAVGWCVEQRAQKVKFVRCIPGLRSRPMVVGTSGQMIDFMPGDPPLGSCPPKADYVVRSPFPSAGALLCLDTKPGDTNVRRH